MADETMPGARLVTVSLDRYGRPAVRGDGDAALLETPALQTAIRWARRADRPGARFIWMQQADTKGYQVTVEIESELPTSKQLTVSVVPLSTIPYELTFRELEVLALLIAGLRNADIAERLSISPRTVATHVDRVTAKMGVPTRTAAATIALDEGIVLLPVPGLEEDFNRIGLIRSLRSPAGSTTWGGQASSRRLIRKPLRLGAALPLLGETAQDGLEMLRGAELAVSEINKRGGINRRPVELVVAKLDHLAPDTITPAFDELAAAEVDALTSGYLGRQDIAHDLAAVFGRPYLNAATLSKMVSRVAEDPRYRRIFQVCPGDAHYAPRFVRYITELRDQHGVRFSSSKLLVMMPTWPLIDLGLPGAAELADAAGWELETAPLGAAVAEWTAAADAARNLAPAAVLVGDYFVSATATFVRRLLENPPPTLLYSLYAPSIPEFRARVGTVAEGLLWATVSGTYSDAPAIRFAKRYHAAYGVPPGRSHAGISYDRVNVLASAWSRVADPRDFDSVAEEIRSSVHRGVNGAYWLGDPSQAALSYPDSTMDPSLGQAHLIYQIQDGRHQIISPAPYSDSVFRKPPWISP